MRFENSNTPSWIIVLIDVIIVSVALLLAYLVRFNFAIPETEIRSFKLVFSTVILVRGFFAFFFGIHKGIVRYTSSRDTERIFLAVTLGTATLAVLNLLRYVFYDEVFIVPFSVLIIEYLASTFLLISLRFAVKLIYFEIKNNAKTKLNVIIYGAGDEAILTKRSLDRDELNKHNVVAFIDPTKRKLGKKVEGVPIQSIQSLNELLQTEKIDHLIMAFDRLSNEKRNQIVEKCLTYNVKVFNVPRISDWINGELTFKQIRDVRIEDLLGRSEIKLDEQALSSALDGKTILVSGAAGSIGSEIVRQLAAFKPELLVLVDQAETPLYELEQELKVKFIDLNFELYLCDVTNEAGMEGIFRQHKPQLVYHAAAYKHVPLVERNALEAIITNVKGSKIMADLAVKFNVERFVMVSTDKAVNPTNVMGATKRAAEIYVQALNQYHATKFITTRFGNVLGSNGSVIPLFRKQIENGGPVTITHPDITRYFMTIPEACQLVLEAGNMGQGGEIFLFDMGASIKIIDLAKKMIKLAGLRLGKDIELKIVGLRPGEKLHEELLATDENSIKTHHPQIMIAQVTADDFNWVRDLMEQMITTASQHNQLEQSVALLKRLVPEFKSKNSVFESLDGVE